MRQLLTDSCITTVRTNFCALLYNVRNNADARICATTAHNRVRMHLVCHFIVANREIAPKCKVLNDKYSKHVKMLYEFGQTRARLSSIYSTCFTSTDAFIFFLCFLLHFHPLPGGTDPGKRER